MKEEKYIITQRGIPLRTADTPEEAVQIAQQYRDGRILSPTPEAAKVLRRVIGATQKTAS